MQTYSYEIPHDVTSRLYGDCLDYVLAVYVCSTSFRSCFPARVNASNGIGNDSRMQDGADGEQGILAFSVQIRITISLSFHSA